MANDEKHIVGKGNRTAEINAYHSLTVKYCGCGLATFLSSLTPVVGQRTSHHEIGIIGIEEEEEEES